MMKELGKRKLIKDNYNNFFLREWLVHGACSSRLPISSVCDCHCIYCCNDSNPFFMCRNVFRNIDDIKLQLELMEPHDEEIRLNDSMCIRIAEGEAFIHPHFFEILKLVRKKYKTNTLSFVTNGSMLSKEFVEKLSFYRPIQISISIHTTQPRLWAYVYGSSHRKANIAIKSLEIMKKFQIDLSASIITMPNILGWDDIEKTYNFLCSFEIEKIELSRPTYTKCTPHHIVKKLKCPLNEFLSFSRKMSSKYPIQNFPRINITAPSSLPIKEIMKKTVSSTFDNNTKYYRNVLWLCSQASYKTIKKKVFEYSGCTSNIHYVVPVRNITFGGNVVVSGHLLVEDYVRAGTQYIKNLSNLDLVLVPKRPFDELFRDITRVNVLEISNRLQKPVWVINDSEPYQPIVLKKLNSVAI